MEEIIAEETREGNRGDETNILTKKERERMALERLKDKRENEKRGGDIGVRAAAAAAPASSRFDNRRPGGRRERQYHRDEKEQSERQRQEQLEQFRKQYAGLRDETEKTKKMKQKAERAKYRFQFD